MENQKALRSANIPKKVLFPFEERPSIKFIQNSQFDQSPKHPQTPHKKPKKDFHIY